jgi:hypothetical protein
VKTNFIPEEPDLVISRPSSSIVPAPRRLAWALAFAFFLFYLAFLAPGIYSLDGNSMLAVAESIVTRHDLTVPAGLGITGRDGHIYSSWYPLQSFLAIPFVAVAAPLARIFRVPLHFVAAVFVGVLPAIFTAASVALVALIAMQLGSSLRGARRAALCFALGTIALVYPRTFYAEPLLMFLVTAGVYLVCTGIPRRVLLASLVAFLAVLAKPTGILLGPALCAYLVVKKTLPFWLRAAPAASAFLGLFVYWFYNWVRFGHPLAFGQPYAFSFATIPVGFAGLLFSPGRGLMWYCPPVVMSIFGLRKALQTKRLEVFLVLTLFAGFLGLHSFWTVWSGGWSWGPRFLLPVLPSLMAFTSLLEGKSKRSLLVLTFAGFMINAPTLPAFYERYYAEAKEQHVPEHAMLWSPSRAPFLHVWGATARVISDSESHDVRDLFRHAGIPSSTIAESRSLQVIAIWWWVLPVVHIPRAAGAAVSLAMMICACYILFRVRLPQDAPGAHP